MKYIALSLFLIVLNFLYSSWSIHTFKEYAKSFKSYRREVEKNLKLIAQIEGMVNYTSAKDYANSKGFTPIDWNKVTLVNGVDNKLNKF